MTKREFVFSIGYDEKRVMVDSVLMSKHKNKNVKELFEAGLYRNAISLALYDNNVEFINYLIESYNKISSSSYTSKIDLERMFGVYVPHEIEKVKVIYM